MARDEEIEIVDVLDDGSWVTSDGEVLTVPEGFTGGRLAYAVAQMAEARAQIKAWTKDAIRWQAVILSQQTEKAAVYGDTVANIRRNPITVYDPIPMAEKAADMIATDLLGGDEIGRRVWTRIRDFVACATGFDGDRLSAVALEEAAPLAKRKPTGALTRAWVDVNHVRRAHKAATRE